MWTPPYHVRSIPLPRRVDGIVSPNDDGSFDIYLNARQPREQQLKWLEHELNHLRRDHFYREMSIAAAEAEADGREPQEAPRRSFPSPEALIAYYREDPARVRRDYPEN